MANDPGIANMVHFVHRLDRISGTLGGEGYFVTRAALQSTVINIAV